MARDHIEGILSSLVNQHYIPRVIVYSNTDFGRIESVVYNVQGDNGHNYYGEPMARFEARKFDGGRLSDRVTVHTTMFGALNAIGVCREF